MSLPYEEELLISHLLEGVKLENPIEVRLAVTGMLKNMAFYPGMINYWRKMMITNIQIYSL